MRKAKRLAVLAAALTVLAAGVAGCGTRVAGTPGSDGSQGSPGPVSAVPLPPRVSAPATLDPDGTVPWVDEPAVEADFATPVTPPPPATGPTCRAAQLTAVLTRWIRKSTGGEAYDPVLDASLYGYATLTNTSRTACRMTGIPSLTLTDDGHPVQLLAGSSRPGGAVGLPPGGDADFRMDWDAPFCPAAQGPYALTAHLPGTGTFPVRLADQTAPGCVHEETHPNLRASLTPSPVAAGSGQAAPLPTSPLDRLKAGAEDVPKLPRPGSTISFTVKLTNPTGTPIPLAGRPGFTLQVSCQGTGGRPGVYGPLSTYLLNNRPVHQVPAHGAVRFTMRATVPRMAGYPGPQLVVVWRMVHRVTAGDPPYVIVVIPTGTR